MAKFTSAGVPIRALNHTMVGQPGLDHTGLEMIGPHSEGPKVWAALAQAGKEFGMLEGGGIAYPTTALETGWVPFPVPAIYSSRSTSGYRAATTVQSLEEVSAIAGSLVNPTIDSYYVHPQDLGY